MKEHIFVILAYKESEYLELCIQSVLNQRRKTNAVIATSTPNAYIDGLAKKYNLEVLVNPSAKKGISYDFDFALDCTDAKFVTIAHQDDTYEPGYTIRVLDRMREDTIICFTDYHEERKEGIVKQNKNLKIKRAMLWPLKFTFIQGLKWPRRRILSLGNPICCPSVTFNKKLANAPLFSNGFKSNMDWIAWEKLSRTRGKFVYIPEDLIMHRVHEASTTTAVIKEHGRGREDFAVFSLFWPKKIAKILTKIYSKSEESNG